jgi:hypothetical protein
LIPDCLPQFFYYTNTNTDKKFNTADEVIYPQHMETATISSAVSLPLPVVGVVL